MLLLAFVLAGGPRTTFKATIKPFAAQYCLKCHTGSDESGVFAINMFPTAASIRKDPAEWKLAAEYLDDKKMPPNSSPQPSNALRKRVSNWIRQYLAGKIREPKD